MIAFQTKNNKNQIYTEIKNPWRIVGCVKPSPISGTIGLEHLIAAMDSESNHRTISKESWRHLGREWRNES